MQVPKDMKDKLEAMAQDAIKRVDEAKTTEEKVEALQNLEATKAVYNAYVFNYDTMVKLS